MVPAAFLSPTCVILCSYVYLGKQVSFKAARRFQVSSYRLEGPKAGADQGRAQAGQARMRQTRRWRLSANHLRQRLPKQALSRVWVQQLHDWAPSGFGLSRE